ncbi:hypothetical protein I7I51_06604 [Histoplasma capsulatum]|uniref:Uncharacterized protein n=1 Tax=Ajellomyces capsulatus TaxID=5037 RepID=A0A8A1MIR4_AJECA|nr:predicted protein [Histoplasma mississippiense (nom. inval.)]EDN06220.1 predicted protein [Histoplasma mississippiense (nom. inval.)]QSS65755.1 hypothetical protein I7I51_06604 [Histoplasma capsulatum]
MFLQRLPAILVLYKLTPKSVQELEGDLELARFFSLEHARHLFPKLGEGDTEETNLIRAFFPSSRAVYTRAKASGTYQTLTMGEVATAKEESTSSSSQLSRGLNLGHGKRASILRIAEANKCDRN